MPIHPDETTELDDCECIGEDDDNLLVDIDGDVRVVPKAVVNRELSQVLDADENAEGSLVVNRQWAVDNGLDTGNADDR